MARVYVVDYWVPFPSSEYGGMQVIVANNWIEAEELIISTVDAYDKEHYPNYKELINDCMLRAKAIKADDSEAGPARFVDQFYT